ncbi:hypothetical protein RhiirB3_431104 [Rhizophagus irregularis]|nr:hypothetical protein RhiirB3_431104 [Rhizophagus irregularis]
MKYSSLESSQQDESNEKDIKRTGIDSNKKSKKFEEKGKGKKSKEILKIPIIPKKNIANRNKIRKNLRAYTNAIYEHDIGTDWNNLALLLITLTGLQEEVQVNINAIGNLYANRGTIMEIPVFYRTREKDPEEWINKFEKTFTANGLENDDVQRFRIAKARLIREVSD